MVRAWDKHYLGTYYLSTCMLKLLGAQFILMTVIHNYGHVETTLGLKYAREHRYLRPEASLSPNEPIIYLAILPWYLTFA